MQTVTSTICPQAFFWECVIIKSNTTAYTLGDLIQLLMYRSTNGFDRIWWKDNFKFVVYSHRVIYTSEWNAPYVLILRKYNYDACDLAPINVKHFQMLIACWQVSSGNGRSSTTNSNNYTVIINTNSFFLIFILLSDKMYRKWRCCIRQTDDLLEQQGTVIILGLWINASTLLSLYVALFHKEWKTSVLVLVLLARVSLYFW